jgi:hypothetical protein
VPAPVFTDYNVARRHVQKHALIVMFPRRWRCWLHTYSGHMIQYGRTSSEAVHFMALWLLKVYGPKDQSV